MIKYFCDACNKEIKKESEINTVTIKGLEGRGTKVYTICDYCRSRLETELDTNFKLSYLPPDPLSNTYSIK